MELLALKYWGRKALKRGYAIPMVTQQNQMRIALSVVSMLPFSEEQKRKLTAESKPLSREKRRDTLERKLGNRPLQDLLVAELDFRHFLSTSTNFIEHLNGKPGLGLVLVGNSLDCGHSLILTAPRKQEFGRLVQVEEKETGNEHDKCDGAQGEN